MTFLGEILTKEIIAVTSIWEMADLSSGSSFVCLYLNLCFTACMEDALYLTVNEITQDTTGKSFMSMQLVFLSVMWHISHRLPLTTVSQR